MTVGTSELHPVPVVSPWYHVGIDFIGPLPPLIVSATSLVNGIHPGAVSFKQSEMKKHLYDCFHSARLSFLSCTKEQTSSLKDQYTNLFPVYCTCRMIEVQGRDMVECSNCLDPH